MDELLSIEQVATRLSIAPKTVRNWIGMKKLPYVKVGRLVRVKLSRLERWIKLREVNDDVIWR